jgi:hypothetical protein
MENRKVLGNLPGDYTCGRGDDIRKRCKRMNMVEIYILI